jgi:Ras-like protein family protein 11A
VFICYFLFNVCGKTNKTTGEGLAKEMECYFAEVAAAEQVSSIADAFNELGREVHAVRRRSKPPLSSSSTHSSLFDRMLGSRSGASIGIRAYARGKSDSALPKD